MTRLLAIDLDGTLFNSQHEISQANRLAVWRAHEAGLNPVIVTGRGRLGAEMALDWLGLDLPFICSAGALVCEGKSVDRVRVLSARTFHQPGQLGQVISFARQQKAGLVADALHGNTWFGADDFGSQLDPLTAAYAYESRRTESPETDFDRPLLKVTLAAGPHTLEQAGRLLDAACPDLHHVYAGLQYVDITAQGVNKGSALEILAAHLGVEKTGIVSVGDQPIDVSMFAVSGLAVAMGNAHPQAQAAAQVLAPSNDQDGVAWLVGQLLEGKL